jgi:hypothetical protein
MPCDADNLGWIDMEMTGLDPKTCVVLEIATLVTDKDLNVLAEGPVLAPREVGPAGSREGICTLNDRSGAEDPGIPVPVDPAR